MFKSKLNPNFREVNGGPYIKLFALVFKSCYNVSLGRELFLLAGHTLVPRPLRYSGTGEQVEGSVWGPEKTEGVNLTSSGWTGRLF